MLDELLKLFGWSGGTRHQVFSAIKNMQADNSRLRRLLMEVLEDPQVVHDLETGLYREIYNALEEKP